MTNILIAEDDNSLRMLYEKALTHNGYHVIHPSAKNGKEAISIFKNSDKKPDIIIMDHRMPLKSGLEATKEILKMNRDTKIIFASADRSVREKALELGVLSFKDKPFTLQRLLENIKKALGNNESEKQGIYQ
ncbi:MAG: response regulator [Promethearchaeia archaeon]